MIKIQSIHGKKVRFKLLGPDLFTDALEIIGINHQIWAMRWGLA